jgi:hypothetical protein
MRALFGATRKPEKPGLLARGDLGAHGGYGGLEGTPVGRLLERRWDAISWGNGAFKTVGKPLGQPVGRGVGRQRWQLPESLKVSQETPCCPLARSAGDLPVGRRCW